MNYARDRPGIEDQRIFVRASLALGQLEEARELLAILDPAELLSAQGQQRAAARDLFALRRELVDQLSAQSGSELRSSLEPTALRTAFPGDYALEWLEIFGAEEGSEDPAVNAAVDRLYEAYAQGEIDEAWEYLAVVEATVIGGGSQGFHDANEVLAEALGQADLDLGWRHRLLLRQARLFARKYAHGEALEILGEALVSNPWDAELRLEQASIAMDALDLALARQALAHAATHELREEARLDPRWMAAQARLAALEGRWSSAERALREAAAKGEHLDSVEALSLAFAMRDAGAVSGDLSHESRSSVVWSMAAELLSSTHDYEAADRLLNHARAEHPNDPYLASAFGLNALRLGREREGRAAIDAAWDRDRFNERTFHTRKLYTETIDTSYRAVESEDIWLRLPASAPQGPLPQGASELIESDLLRAIRETRAKLDQAYGVEIGPLRVEVYADPQDFSVRTVGVPDFGALGVCFGPVVTLVGPFTGRHNFGQVLHHELAHVYALHLSQNKVPRWFTEGLSEWESELEDPSWARESADLLRTQGGAAGPSQLELAFLHARTGRDMELAYATSAYALRFLGERYGRERLIEMLKDWGHGKHTAEIFRARLELDPKSVDKAFSEWLDDSLKARVQGWDPVSGATPAELGKLLEGADRAASGGLGNAELRELDEALEEAARDYDGPLLDHARARVAAARGRFERAVSLYEKAHQKAPERIPLLAEWALVARRADRFDEELRVLALALSVDHMSLDPSVRALALSAALGEPELLGRAARRCQLIAPLHPACLAGRSLGDLEGKDEALDLALNSISAESKPETLGLVAVAAKLAGRAEATQLRPLAESHPAAESWLKAWLREDS